MSYRINLRLFKKDVITGKQIVLFLGAGVNYSKGVNLLWEDIINPLMRTSLIRVASDKGLSNQELQDLLNVFEITDTSSLSKDLGYFDVKKQVIYEYTPQVKAMLVKSILKDQYIASFQEKIYKECNRTILREVFTHDYILSDKELYKAQGRFYTLYTIARMILLNPHVRAIVTYNYDNFLTHVLDIMQENPELYFKGHELKFLKDRLAYINKKKIKAIDIFGDSRPDIYESGTIFIYHPHGYIPSPNQTDNLESSQIIMSMDEYCDNTTRVYSWDNDTQVHLLSHYTCVFIGSSISDLTTQRMLHYANKNGNKSNIYNLSAKPVADKDKYSERCSITRDNLAVLKDLYYKQCGMTNIFCQDGYGTLLNDVNNITSSYSKQMLERKQSNN